MRTKFLNKYSFTPPPGLAATAVTMEDKVTMVEPLINKWDVDGSGYAKITSLFHESRDAPRFFLLTISELKIAMQFFADNINSSSSFHSHLARAQRLMQAAMKRLAKEFHSILVTNHDLLDSESLSKSTSSVLSRVSTSSCSLSDMDEQYRATADGDDICSVEGERQLPFTAMDDLRLIAECMISNGYAKECFDVYKTTRRPIVRDGLRHRLGFEKLGSSSHVHKLDWDSVDQNMKRWSMAVPVAVRSLFLGEKVLSDYVFSSKSTATRESCFAEITRDAAVEFFAFPAHVESKSKKSPERIFQFLDTYCSIFELLPEIETLFPSKPTSSVLSQALASFDKLGNSVNSMLADFESAIRKDSSKAVVPGGGIHPLTRYVMNYLVFLADYDCSLVDIYADHPFPRHTIPPDSILHFINTTSCSPISHSSSLNEEGGVVDDNAVDESSHVSTRLAWILFVLLCKLDGKAGLYKDVALSYLFLANNLRYVVGKVRDCSKLRQLLGHDWVIKNDEKARTYAKRYEKLAWVKVVEALPTDPVNLVVVEGAEAANKRMAEFNRAFEDACRAQSLWVVADEKMRDEIKALVATKVVVPYRTFYELYQSEFKSKRDSGSEVRFAPVDVADHVSRLFSVTGLGSTPFDPSNGRRL